MPRAQKITAEITVLGGFPVLATADLCPPEPDVGIFEWWVDDLQLLTRKGKPADFITGRMTKRDWEYAEEALLNAA